MANIGAYVRSKLDEFRNNIQRSVNDNKGFVQQGHLTAQPIQQAVNNVVNRPFENIGQRLQQVNQTIPQGNPFIRGLQAFPQATKITGQELGKFNPAIKYASNQVIDNVLEGGRNYLTAGNNKLQAGLGALQVGGGVFNATPYGAQFNAAVGGLTAAAKAQREKRQLKLNDVVGSITKPVSPFGEGLGVKDPMLATAGDLGLYAVMGKVGKGNTGKEIMAADDAVKGLIGKIPTFAEAQKLIAKEGGYVGAKSLPAVNQMNAEQIGGSLGLNPKYLYEQATKKGINLNEWRQRLDSQTDMVSRIKVGDELLSKLSETTKQAMSIEPAEIKRVADNLIKNNRGLQQKEAEAMAKDVIAGRQFNQSQLSTTGGANSTPPLSPIEDVGGNLRLKGEQGSGVGERGVKQLKVKPTRLEQIAIDETKPIDEKLGVKTPQITTPKLQSVKPEIQQPSLEANISQPPTTQTQKVKQVSQTIQPQGSGVGGQVPIEQKGSPDNLISKIKEKASKLYTESLDRFNPITKLGRQAGEETKIKRALTGHYGAGSTATYHIDFELTPILKENNIDEVRRVAIAQRDVELAGRNIKGSNTGLKLDELKKELGDEKFNAIQGTLKKLYSYQDTMVKKYLVDTGVISKEGYAAMKSNNQSYIPFKRVMDTVDEYLGVTPPARGAGSVSTQGVIKKIKGSERAIVDPIESIIENTYKTVGLGRRQEVAKTIVGLRSQLPSGTIQEIKGTVGNKPNISLFVNGKVKHYAVPPELADAAKGLSEEGLNTIVKMFASPTRVFRATATGVNPEFALPNVTRDLQSAFVNVGLNPLKWVKGLAHMIKKDEVYQQFLKEGGLTSRISLDRPYLKQTVKGITGKGHVLDVVNPKKLYEFMQVAGQYSEQPTRIAVFEQQYLKGLKKGLSQADAARDAAYWAQEATVNFARRGSKTQSINALYAFLNARAQGTDRLIRSFKANPAQVGLRIGLISQVPAMALYAHNRNFDSYNNKRVVTQTDKDNNFIFMLSDTPIDLPFPGMKGIQYIKISKGDIGKLANPTEQFMSYADGKGGDTKAALVSSLKAFSPIDNIGGFLPTAFVPPVEVASNHNFFYNSEIVPDYKKGYPAKYQDTSYTSPLYREIGQKTNISPAKIQAIVEGYGTGIAKIGAKLAEPLVGEQYKSDKNKQGAEINKTPILRRFLGGERRTEEEQQLTDIKRSRAIEFDIRDIKGAIKRGDIPQDEGIRQIEKLKQDQIQPSGAKGNSDVLAQFYGYGEHLKSPPSSGLAKYDWEDKKLSEAIKLFNDKDVDGGWRDQYIKKYGYDTNDLRYEAYSRLNETVRSGYLKDELSKQDSQQRIETLKSLRTESISGKVVATDKVLKELNDEGLISDADYKALKAVKYGKDGKLTTKSLKGKKPKKLSVAKVGGRKAGRISVKKAKKVSLKALKLKPIKLVARRSKPKA